MKIMQFYSIEKHFFLDAGDDVLSFMSRIYGS